MPTPYRYTTIVAPQAATGEVAAVYAQIASDFVRADGPLRALSVALDLLAATWAVLREAHLVGAAPRSTKEIIATAVSVANRCPFCVDAHAALVHATGAHRSAEAVWRGAVPADPDHAALAAWAATTASPRPQAPPPPLSFAPEYIGTVLVHHFINRIVSVLLDENLLPGGLRATQVVRRLAGRALARNVRRTLRPGESLPLIAGADGRRPSAAAAWTGDTGTAIGTALAALHAAAATGGMLLDDASRQVVQTAVADWDGAHPPMSGTWLQEALAGLPATSRPGARIALLAALAPYRVSAADVDAWRSTHPTDAALVRVVAYGAMTAVGRIERWTTAALPDAAATAAPRRRG